MIYAGLVKDHVYSQVFRSQSSIMGASRALCTLGLTPGAPKKQHQGRFVTGTQLCHCGPTCKLAKKPECKWYRATDAGRSWTCLGSVEFDRRGYPLCFTHVRKRACAGACTLTAQQTNSAWSLGI